MCVHVSVLRLPSLNHKSPRSMSHIANVSSSHYMHFVGATVTHHNFLYPFGHATSHTLCVLLIVISYTHCFALLHNKQNKTNDFSLYSPNYPPFKSPPLSTLMHPPTLPFWINTHHIFPQLIHKFP